MSIYFYMELWSLDLFLQKSFTNFLVYEFFVASFVYHKKSIIPLTSWKKNA